MGGLLVDKVCFAKVNPNAIIPSKRDEDGAYDVYPCFEHDDLSLYPSSITMIPTGIASAFDSKYRIVFQERGSTGIKGMKINAGLIDSGFRGEWFVIINNTSDKLIIITKNENLVKKFPNQYYSYNKAICQAKIQLVPKVDIVEISYDELKNITSERGMGQLGSTDKPKDINDKFGVLLDTLGEMGI
jgi:dUTP pyrophosphatase